MWILKLEEKLFYLLLRRNTKRMSISQLENWLTWFNLDFILKKKGLEQW